MIKRLDLSTMALRVFAAALYVFMLGPLVVVVVFSFNSGESATQFEGFSLRWFQEAWTDPVVLDALRNSLQIAFSAGALSVVLGTAGALGVSGLRPRWRRLVEFLGYVAVIVPALVLGISLLLGFVLFSDWANPWLAYLWPGDTAPQLGLGRLSVIAGDSVFGVALTMVIVRARFNQMDPALQQASSDLGASRLGTLWQVTLPQLRSAMAGAFILATTFAWDDFIIAFFTRGEATTLPVLLFSSIRRGVSPSVNAIATVLVASTVLMLLLGLLVLLHGRQGRSLDRQLRLGASGAEGTADSR